MKILGIDPGLCVTGYGLIGSGDKSNLGLIEAGVIRTGSKDKIGPRIKKIRDGVRELIKEYEPNVLVLEKLYSHYKHPVTSILMGHARGAVCLAASEAGLDLINYPATRIKKAITGNGHASKWQIQGMVTQILGLKKRPEPLDVSDALAMAIAYAYIEIKQNR